jgi:tryptophan halogenase
MPIPDSLAERWDLYRRTGRIYREKEELFSESSWLAVFEGQEAGAEGYDPVADLMPEQKFREQMQQIHAVIQNSAYTMPAHIDFIRANCAARPADATAATD